MTLGVTAKTISKEIKKAKEEYARQTGRKTGDIPGRTDKGKDT